jgi:hypothetical protein
MIRLAELNELSLITRIVINFNSSNSFSLKGIVATLTAATVKKLEGNPIFDSSRSLRV